MAESHAPVLEMLWEARHRQPRPAGLRLGPGRVLAGPRRRQGRPTRQLRSDSHPACLADSGVAGRLVNWARDLLRTTVEIVRKPADQKGFFMHPRRWVMERTLAWLTAHRRLARDYETHRATSEAMIRWAALGGMLRRLTRGKTATRQQRRTFSTPD